VTLNRVNSVFTIAVHTCIYMELWTDCKCEMILSKLKIFSGNCKATNQICRLWSLNFTLAKVITT
jgi:hypothetical protein